MTKLSCPNCKYTWLPRLEKPSKVKCCPRCKHYLNWKPTPDHVEIKEGGK